MEKILSITDSSDFKIPGGDWQSYEGWIVETDRQKIFIGVSNRSCCCESWGHVISEDDTKAYIGAELLGVDVVDKALNHKVLEGVGDTYDGNTMFVNLATSEGLLQFAVYNSHNGYYSHDARVHSTQLQHTECL